jgi:hypothetical protein
MKRLILTTLLLATGCAHGESIAVNCRLWDALPATHQRKFIHQGNFSEALADRAEIRRDERAVIDSVCNESTLHLGMYYPWP